MNNLENDIAKILADEQALIAAVEKLPLISYPSWLPRLTTDGIGFKLIKQFINLATGCKYSITVETGDDGMPTDRDFFTDMNGIRIHNGWYSIWFECSTRASERLKLLAIEHGTTVNKLIVDGKIPANYLDYDADVILSRWSHNRAGEYCVYIRDRLCGSVSTVSMANAKIIKAYESGIVNPSNLIIVMDSGNVMSAIDARQYIQNYLLRRYRERYHD